MKAIWEGVILAESDETIMVDGTHFFPHHSIQEEFFNPSTTNTTSNSLGQANYYNIHVNDKMNQDAAYYYPRPKETGLEIKGYVAFCNGVIITEE